MTEWSHLSDNGRVLTMNEPQVWTLIGVFAASMVGVITLLMTMTNRMFQSLRSELQTEMRAGFGRIEAVMDARFEKVDARFEKVETQIEHLDRDVSAIIRRDHGDAI